MISNLYSPLAQLVEQVTVNHLVLGSSPRWGAKQNRHLQDFLVGAFSVFIISFSNVSWLESSYYPREVLR